MNITLWLIAGGFVFLVGFVVGARFEEGNLELRERRLAQLRRRAREGRDEYPGESGGSRDQPRSTERADRAAAAGGRSGKRRP